MVASSGASDIADALETYRTLRRGLEESVLPLATSLDGRRFELQSSLHHLEFQPGGYVVIEDGDGTRLGQVLSVEPAEVQGPAVAVPSGNPSSTMHATILIRAARGAGVVLSGHGGSFHDASVRVATSAEVGAWLDGIRPGRAVLPVGELLLAPGVALELDSGGFNRHTFLCGQSGSGKTYSLGVVLERLLADTELQVVILDPNSDYVRLGAVRASASPEVAARYAAAADGVVVHSAGEGAQHPLRLGFGHVDPAARAAILQLDPIVDREEYALLETMLGGTDARATLRSFDELMSSPSPDAHKLGLRANNLGVDRWGIWPRGRGGSIVEAIERRDARCLVVDLGSLPTRGEQAAVAEAVLATLWRRRTDRSPVLIVIDEAHNVCPHVSEDPVTALATQHAVRIAAEGRKFGLYLFVASQRPQKVHENVLSQCDNLVLMRMNSFADLGFIGEVFSFVAPTLLARATTFGLGEALVAGKIASHPALIHFGTRIAEEGGSDVPADWAGVRGSAPRSSGS